jgi:hypothetical protein
LSTSDGVETHPDSDPFHYDPELFKHLCAWIDNIEVEYIGEYEHPLGQEMLAFRID